MMIFIHNQVLVACKIGRSVFYFILFFIYLFIYHFYYLLTDLFIYLFIYWFIVCECVCGGGGKKVWKRKSIAMTSHQGQSCLWVDWLLMFNALFTAKITGWIYWFSRDRSSTITFWLLVLYLSAGVLGLKVGWQDAGVCLYRTAYVGRYVRSV